MTTRSILAAVVLALMCCGVRPLPAAELNTGIVTLTTTGGANSIGLNVTVADNGAAAGCTYFIIKRSGGMIAFFPRQPGVLNTYSLTDTNVLPGRTYWYELTVSSLPVPVPSPACDEAEFRLASGSSWGLPLDVPGHAGESPVVLAQGTLVADENWPYAHLEPCNSPNGWFFEYGLPAGFEAYIGQDVLMYGDYSGWSVQFGWIPIITAFEPAPCPPVATKQATWGHVKTIYR